MERYMQYMWQHRLWQRGALLTVDGEPVDVVDAGLLNTGAGPDFFNAKVRIGGRMWAGNVEIHVRASDWYRHGHDDMHGYGNVVLHVVARSDTRIMRSNNTAIPQLVMTGVEEFMRRHSTMTCTAADNELPCAGILRATPAIYITDWISALAYERLYAKAERVMSCLRQVNGNWRAAFYVTLARAMGFSTNNDAFERLALAVPLNCLMHHQGNKVAVEAMLLGQAGLLAGAPPATPEEDYMNILRREYAFLSAKYGLPEPKPLGWRMARMRPQSFPQRRIALLAAIIAEGFGIACRLFSNSTVGQVRELLNVQVSEFWKHHYTFATPYAANAGSVLSSSSVDSLIINAIVPTIAAYSVNNGCDDVREHAVEMLQQLLPERNNIVRTFESAGIVCRDAFTTQALVQLKRGYCEARKCMYCRFGHRYLTRQ